MKKKILILSIIILIALPVINGIVMEKSIHTIFENINDINSISGSPYSVKLISYNRRLFHSDIEWQVDIGPMKPMTGLDNIIIHDRVKHRFLGVTTISDLNTNTWYKEFVEKQTNGKDPLTIVTDYSLFGKIQSNLSATPFAIRVDDHTLEVGKAHLATTTTRDIEYVKTEGELSSLTIQNLATLDVLTVASDLKYHPPYIWAGEMSMEFDKLAIINGEEKGELDDFTFTYSLDMDDKSDKMSFFTTFSGDSLTVPDKTSIKDITAKIGFRHVDRKGYDAFMEQYAEILAPLANQVFNDNIDITGNEIDSQLTSAGMQMMGTLEKLLTKDLEFVIEDVAMDFPEGKLSAAVNLKLLHDMTLIQLLPLLTKPSHALNIFSLRAEAQIPAALIKDTSFLTMPLSSEMETGLFQEEGDILVHTSKTKNNRFILNGHEVNLDLL